MSANTIDRPNPELIREINTAVTLLQEGNESDSELAKTITALQTRFRPESNMAGNPMALEGDQQDSAHNAYDILVEIHSLITNQVAGRVFDITSHELKI